MKKLNAKHFSGSNERIKGKKVIFSSISGAVVGLGFLILILLSFSAVCMLMDSPHRFILPIAFFAVYSASFLAGLFAIKRNDNSDALICGGICGVLFMIAVWSIFTLIGYVLPSNEPSMTFVLKLIIVPVSVLGAFAGIGSTSHKKAKENSDKSIFLTEKY